MQPSLSISLRDLIAAAVLGPFAFAFCPNIQGQNPPPTPRSVDDVVRTNTEVVAVAPNKIPPDVSADAARLPYWTEISLEQLPAGRYTLEVSATDRAANSNASQTISFSVD